MSSSGGVNGGWQPSGAAKRNKRKEKLEKQAALLKKIPKMSMFAQPLSSQHQSGDNINLVDSSIENDGTRTQQRSGENIIWWTLQLRMMIQEHNNSQVKTSIWWTHLLEIKVGMWDSSLNYFCLFRMNSFWC